MTTRLESLQRQQAQLKEQIQQIQSRERTKEGRKQARRKFLIGEAILSEVESGRFKQTYLVSIMNRFLTTENDRALFGLESQSDNETADSRTGHLILDAEFEKRSRIEVVEELLPTIEHYRSKGKSLSEIYTALCKKNLLSTDCSFQMSFATFKNTYYQKRQRKEASTDSQLERSKPNGVEKEVEPAEAKQIGKTRAESVVQKKRRRSIVKGSKAG